MRKKMPKVIYPRGIELAYALHLRIHIRKLYDEIIHRVKDALPHLHMEAQSELQKDGWPDDVSNLLKQMELYIDFDTKHSLQSIIGQAAHRTLEWNDIQWRNILKRSIGVESPFSGRRFELSFLKSFINTNTDLIEKLNTEALITTRRILESGLRSGDRQETIAETLIEQLGEKMENRADFIARDQVAKFNGDLTKARQTTLGISKYIWRTMEDERVRPTHAALDGKICKWDDDNVYSDDNGETWKERTGEMFKGKPGDDYLCRCYGEAVLDELMEENNNTDEETVVDEEQETEE